MTDGGDSRTLDSSLNSRFAQNDEVAQIHTKSPPPHFLKNPYNLHNSYKFFDFLLTCVFFCIIRGNFQKKR